MMIRSALVVVLMVWALPLLSHSLRFDMQSGETKCISEDIKRNSMTMGTYRVVNPNDDRPLGYYHLLSVKVRWTHGLIIQSAEKVGGGEFVFTTAEQGDYMTCFTAPGHSPSTTLTVDFEWRTSVQFKEWVNIAKKGQVDDMELELRKLHQTVNSIHEELFYFREIEEEMEELTQETTTKMIWLSFLSLFLGLSVAGIQFWYLKTFFQRRKLI
ncbi:Transmembrane emp24 domain-containing protein p24delta9 [Hibiscus syriacus]|uniref:Transmembrane emp24 domain-containing protein p24delta9 n=1 Tax=Hibiscus syriacus TaxID=106335 RepID=A0A6A3BSH8_HIBSY|nr:transmembrane emp24 domain-containing protein p24delta9-like [Hibiscus syriacus]KAE8719796.1 Transmembrane emp24 domain-containing protein p24delta9 [Hibiscus syriacus]